MFDFDGLMIDSERVLADCIVEVLASRDTYIAVEQFAHLFGSTENDDEWEELVSTWCEPRLSSAELEALLTPVVRPRVEALPLLPGVRELLDQAGQAGWKIGLGTGQSIDRLEPALQRLDVRDRFDAVVTAGEVERGKPAPDVYLEVARRLHVEPGVCLVLEDSVPGCHAALSAGMSVVVCPSVTSDRMVFPAEARRVKSLIDVDLTRLVYEQPGIWGPASTTMGTTTR